MLYFLQIAYFQLVAFYLIRNIFYGLLLTLCSYEKINGLLFIVILSKTSTKLDVEACKNRIYVLWHSFFYALLAF